MCGILLFAWLFYFHQFGRQKLNADARNCYSQEDKPGRRKTFSAFHALRLIWLKRSRDIQRVCVCARAPVREREREVIFFGCEKLKSPYQCVCILSMCQKRFTINLDCANREHYTVLLQWQRKWSATQIRARARHNKNVASISAICLVKWTFCIAWRPIINWCLTGCEHLAFDSRANVTIHLF